MSSGIFFFSPSVNLFSASLPRKTLVCCPLQTSPEFNAVLRPLPKDSWLGFECWEGIRAMHSKSKASFLIALLEKHYSLLKCHLHSLHHRGQWEFLIQQGWSLQSWTHMSLISCHYFICHMLSRNWFCPSVANILPCWGCRCFISKEIKAECIY